MTVDALKIKNYRTFAVTELVDVQAAAGVLTKDIIPIVGTTWSMACPSLCNAIAEWMVAFESTRADVLRMERTCWRQYEQIFKVSLLGVCLRFKLRMRWARYQWVRKQFERMRMQFQVETAVDLSCGIRACMEKDDSIVYVGFNICVKRPYYGMVHSRGAYQRCQEHCRVILQHGAGIATEKELKCSYMSKTGVLLDGTSSPTYPAAG